MTMYRPKTTFVERREYELTQIVVPATDFLAVWADLDRADPTSPVRLRTEPVDAIGIAAVSHYKHCVDADHPVNDLRPRTLLRVAREAVALVLIEGEFCICQEFDNFGGLIRCDDDATNASVATTCLRGVYEERRKERGVSW